MIDNKHRVYVALQVPWSLGEMDGEIFMFLVLGCALGVLMLGIGFWSVMLFGGIFLVLGYLGREAFRRDPYHKAIGGQYRHFHESGNKTNVAVGQGSYDADPIPMRDIEVETVMQ